MRRHDDEITLRLTSDGVPRTFRWRGRAYAVTAVQATWRERRSWWRDLAVDPEHEPAGERTVWQVEAGPVPTPTGGRAGVYRIATDGARWHLVGLLD